MLMSEITIFFSFESYNIHNCVIKFIFTTTADLTISYCRMELGLNDLICTDEHTDDQ